MATMCLATILKSIFTCIFICRYMYAGLHVLFILICILSYLGVVQAYFDNGIILSHSGFALHEKNLTIIHLHSKKSRRNLTNELHS